jgi:hypothetical protein
MYYANINAIDRYKEAHSPQNVDEIFDALITIATEMMALSQHKVRKFVVKRETGKPAARTREFHAIGLDPGGAASSHPPTEYYRQLRPDSTVVLPAATSDRLILSAEHVGSLASS